MTASGQRPLERRSARRPMLRRTRVVRGFPFSRPRPPAQAERPPAWTAIRQWPSNSDAVSCISVEYSSSDATYRQITNSIPNSLGELFCLSRGLFYGLRKELIQNELRDGRVRKTQLDNERIQERFVNMFEGSPIENIFGDRKSTRLNSSHSGESRMPSSA